MLKPLRDLLLVKEEKAEDKLASGLYMPGTVEKNLVKAVVVSVGPGYMTESCTMMTPTLKEGDRVLFPKNNSMEVKDGSEVLLLVREDVILCKVE